MVHGDDPEDVPVWSVIEHNGLGKPAGAEVGSGMAPTEALDVNGFIVWVGPPLLAKEPRLTYDELLRLPAAVKPHVPSLSML